MPRKIMPKTCYMLVGLPGSGKSTMSEQLLKDMPGLEVVSTDIYVEQHAKAHNISFNEAMRALGDKPKAQMNNRVQQLMKEEKSFIWDQTNVFVSARLKKLKALLKNKYEVVALVTELSPEELSRRLEKRITEGGKQVSWKIINNMQENYSRPSYSEGFSQVYLVQDDAIARLLEKPIMKNRI